MGDRLLKTYYHSNINKNISSIYFYKTPVDILARKRVNTRSEKHALMKQTIRDTNFIFSTCLPP